MKLNTFNLSFTKPWTSSFLFLRIFLAFTCAHLGLTLCHPVDCRLPGPGVHVIFQARILDWVAISFSKGFFRPRNSTCISCISWIGRWVLYHWHCLGSPVLFCFVFCGGGLLRTYNLSGLANIVYLWLNTHTSFPLLLSLQYLQVSEVTITWSLANIHRSGKKNPSHHFFILLTKKIGIKPFICMASLEILFYSFSEESSLWIPVICLRSDTSKIFPLCFKCCVFFFPEVNIIFLLCTHIYVPFQSTLYLSIEYNGGYCILISVIMQRYKCI